MPPCFVGLDIAKGHIDVSVRPTGEHWQGGIISAAIGTQVAPGKVVIYMGQTLNFLAPVYLGDTVTAKLNVISTNAPRRQATLLATVVNQDGVEVLKGESRIMIEDYED